MPLSAITAWSLARRLTDRSWLPTVGALVWALAPPLLGSLSTGHLGAVITHILLPWLVLLTLRARASWAALPARQS